MVFGWRQEFSCGFGVAWAGSERKPSLANVLQSRVPGWGGAMHGGMVRRGAAEPRVEGATPQPWPWALPRVPSPARPVGDN
ncbi:hypothetical protein [Corynebacterium matruchotii]|uniref:hypothetical protein n=1 Tax=Corynebacterium matruchotii TaxID=43768 RepID=UPI0028EE7BFE|nr:hypothetical protein [Corynebacterium matruchotii]